MMAATARKTSLENEHLRNFDNFAGDHPILFAFYNVGKISEDHYNWIGVCAVKSNTET